MRLLKVKDKADMAMTKIWIRSWKVKDKADMAMTKIWIRLWKVKDKADMAINKIWIKLQYNTMQIYCLFVEKFAMWLVIYIKH